MFSKQEVLDVKEHLGKAQNPLFLFDDDPDGLSSFLILQRFLGRGQGVAIKSYPALSTEYLSKVREFNSDYIFILDKPVVSSDFFDNVRKMNLPVVWIDHHEKQGEIPSFVHYYNPIYSKEKSDEPVSFLCYSIVENEKDLWISVVGSIADKFLPPTYTVFQERYPDLSIEAKEPFDVLYKSPIGRLSRMIHSGLKDKTSNVNKMLQFLMQVKSPYEVLEEVKENAQMHKRFQEIETKLLKFFERASKKANSSSKLLFFTYNGDTSFSGDLANRMAYSFPDKTIIIGYIKGNVVNISGRGDNVRDLVLKAISNFEGANGGGHEKAVGARIKVDDLKVFEKKLKEFLG